MPHIKAVIMDGDGSTITHDGILPSNLRDLILAKPHIKWIMATGRSLDLLRRLPIIDYLSQDVPHIVDGGGSLVLHNGTSVINHFLTEAEIHTLFDQLELTRIEFLYYSLTTAKSYLFSHTNLAQWSTLPQFSMALATTNIDQYRSWALSQRPTKIFIRIKQAIHLHGLTWHQNESNIDVTATGVTKGSSCYQLLQLLNLRPHEVVFVFNDHNDLPLIEHPQLQDIITIKVGNFLPNTQSLYHVASPYEVAPVLGKIFAKLN